MQLINISNMPAPLFRAIAMATDDYSGKGEKRFASVTDLFRPPYMQALFETHKDDLKIDAKRCWHRFLGKAFHDYMERANKGQSGVITEARLSVEFDHLYKITGGFDHYEAEGGTFGYDDGELVDHKFTSGYKILRLLDNPEELDEWLWQLNCYGFMLRRAGFPVTELKAAAYAKDWSEMKEEKRKFPLWHEFRFQIERDDVIEQMMRIRILKLIGARILMARGGEPEACSQKERWEKPEKWAVMKQGNVRAIKNGLREDRQQAERMAHELTKKSTRHYVEHRASDRVRCRHYCDVRDVCKDYARYQKETWRFDEKAPDF